MAQLRTVTGQSVHENTISALLVVHVGESTVSETTPTGFELVVAGSYDRQMPLDRALKSLLRPFEKGFQLFSTVLAS